MPMDKARLDIRLASIVWIGLVAITCYSLLLILDRLAISDPSDLPTVSIAYFDRIWRSALVALTTGVVFSRFRNKVSESWMVRIDRLVVPGVLLSVGVAIVCR